MILASLQRTALLATVGACRCALPLTHVIETMRPLMLQAVGGMQPFVLGISIVRGLPIPVVDLGVVLGSDTRLMAGRWVTVRVERRQVALAVDGVSGVLDLRLDQLQKLPPLLQQANAEVVQAIGALDSQLLLMLQVARVLPEDVWRELEELGAGSSA